MGEISNLRDELKTAEGQYRTLIEKQGFYKRRHDEIEREIPALNNEISLLLKKEKVAKKAQLLMDTTESAAVEIYRQLNDYVKTARGVITKSVNSFLDKTTHETISVNLDEKFSLKITFDDENELGKSGDIIIDRSKPMNLTSYYLNLEAKDLNETFIIEF